MRKWSWQACWALHVQLLCHYDLSNSVRIQYHTLWKDRKKNRWDWLVTSWAYHLTSCINHCNDHRSFVSTGILGGRLDRIWVNPDCGLKTRGWEETIPALRNMVQVCVNVVQVIFNIQEEGLISTVSCCSLPLWGMQLGWQRMYSLGAMWRWFHSFVARIAAGWVGYLL